MNIHTYIYLHRALRQERILQHKAATTAVDACAAARPCTHKETPLPQDAEGI